jgi:hypothetical protein
VTPCRAAARPEPVDAVDSGGRAARADATSALLSLQRSIGNRATAALVARRRVLARGCDPETSADCDPNDPHSYDTFEEFAAGAVGPWTDEGLKREWDDAHPPAPAPAAAPQVPWDEGPRGERIPVRGYRGPLRPKDKYTKPYAVIHAEQGNYEAAELAEHYMCPTCHVLTQVDPRDFSLRGYVSSYEHGYLVGGTLLGGAALGLAAPELAAVLGAWETGVSTGEAVTGETSGAHVTDPLFGVEPGRELSTSERVFHGVSAALGWAGMGLGALAGRASETTGALTNLGGDVSATNRLVLDEFRAGQGFSGVFDEATGSWIAAPSTRAAEIPQHWVSARGGHAVVSGRLNQVIGPAAGRRAGFTVFLEEDGSLGVEWLSRSVNGRANPLVPEDMRPSILEALTGASGRTARSR